MHRDRRRSATMTLVIAPTETTRPPTEAAINPNTTLWLLSIAHAVNHAQAVLLPLVYVRIIGEFGVSTGTVALLAAAGGVAPGVVPPRSCKLTPRVSEAE